MNYKLENKFSMLKTVKTVEQKNLTAINTVAAVKASFTKFDSKLDEIEAVIRLQIKDITGYAAVKKDLINTLCESGLTIAAALFAFGAASKNLLIKKGSDYSISDLKKLRDNTLVETCSNIHTLAVANLTALDPYGIDEQALIDFKKIIDDTSAANAVPTSEIDLRKGYTSQLNVLFHEISIILSEEVDKTMILLKKTFPSFYAYYKNARSIIDLKGKRKTILIDDPAINSAIFGFVYNELDSSLIEDALVEIEILEISDNTDEDGEYYLEKVPKGTHTIKASAPSYNQKEIPGITLADKEILSLDIYLTPSELPTVEETPEPE